MTITPFSLNSILLPLAVTTSASASRALPNSGRNIRFYNATTNVIYVHIATGTATATNPVAGTVTSTSHPVPPGDSTFALPNVDAILNISAIGAEASTLLVQVGSGI